MNKIGFRESRVSEKYYFEWRKNRAKPAINLVDHVVRLKNKQVLDVGCGYGALSSIILKKGAHVYATEKDKYKLEVAKRILKGKNIKFTQVKNEKLPYKNDFFDVVFLFDVIEHIGNPKKMISECSRVLKKDGVLYVEFTPYYSVIGHHLYDYSKLPLHILPRTIIKKFVFSKKPKSFMSQKFYWDLFTSLNKLRIRDFQNMVNKDFLKIEENFIIKYPEIFEVKLNIINYLGPIKDLFTMSFEGLYKKERDMDYFLGEDNSKLLL